MINKSIMSWHKPLMFRYFVALLLSVTGIFVVYFISSIEGTHAYSLVVLSVLLSAILGGFGPAIFSALITSVSIDFFFEPPINHIFDTVASFIRVFNYLFLAIVISSLMAKIQTLFKKSESEQKLLEDLIREKDGIVAAISHDIRNSLTHILGFSESLNNRDFDNNPLEKELAITHIVSSSRQILRLVQDLLDFSSLKSQNSFIFSTIDLLRILNTEISKLAKTAKNKEIKLKLQTNLRDVFIKGDEIRMIQVIENLIGNAIKFSRSFTTITVTLELKNQKLLLEISDQGPGLTASDLKHLFKPFLKLSNKPTNGESSHGIGLSIVHSIIEKHGAKISVESRYGYGSSFIIDLTNSIHSADIDPTGMRECLTKKENLTLPDVINKPKFSFQGAPIHVLIAEDDLINQKIALRFFSKFSCEVTIVENGAVLLSALEKEAFDIIFMDCQMPIMDGYEATEKIRKLGYEKSSIPIIGLTSDISTMNKTKCVSIGMNDIISKPYNDEEIIRIFLEYFPNNFRQESSMTRKPLPLREA